MNEADILNQLRIIAREHTIKIVEGHMEETMPASVVNELRLNNFSAKILLDYITNLQNQLQQKENIIKEVRELLKNDYFEDGSFNNYKKVFELLDKESE